MRRPLGMEVASAELPSPISSLADQRVLEEELRTIIAGSAPLFETVTVRALYSRLAEKYDVPLEALRGNKPFKKRIKKLSIKIIERWDTHAPSPRRKRTREAESRRTSKKKMRKDNLCENAGGKDERQGIRAADNRSSTHVVNALQKPGKRKKSPQHVGQKTGLPSSISRLRKLVAELSFGPSIYRNLGGDAAATTDPENYKQALRRRIIEKSVQAGVLAAGSNDLPSAAEVAAYKQRRAKELELDGVDVRNIISGKRRTNAHFEIAGDNSVNAAGQPSATVADDGDRSHTLRPMFGEKRPEPIHEMATASERTDDDSSDEESSGNSEGTVDDESAGSTGDDSSSAEDSEGSVSTDGHDSESGLQNTEKGTFR